MAARLLTTNRTAFAAPISLRPQLTATTIHDTVRQAASKISHMPAFRPLKPSAFIATRPRMTITGPPKPTVPPKPPATPVPNATYKLALLYDSDCPLCLKEVNFLRRRVDAHGPPPSINFVDIASPDYNPTDYAGIDYETAMGRIHGLKQDGSVIVGVPVFRAAYEAVGLGWVYAVTKIPGVGAAADAVYNVWADYRLQFTGRPPLEDVMRMRREEAEKTCRSEGE